jgi:hypothetical protein
MQNQLLCCKHCGTLLTAPPEHEYGEWVLPCFECGARNILSVTFLHQWPAPGWEIAGKERRRAYIQRVIESGLFAERIFYSHYSQTKEYTRLTIATTANAILEIAEDEYEATIIIDGLNKTERITVATGLRKQHIHVRKVRGVADESDALIRLADAMAGFIRDCLEEDAELLPLYGRAMRQKIIRELK